MPRCSSSTFKIRCAAARAIGPLLPQFADAAVAPQMAHAPAGAASGPPSAAADADADVHTDANATANVDADADALVSAVQGLGVGEQVVTVGQHLLVPGATVQVGPPPP